MRYGSFVGFCKSLRVHQVVLSKFPQLLSKLHTLSRRSMNPLTTCYKCSYDSIPPENGSDDRSPDNRNLETSSLTLDLDFRVVVEIMRFVYEGIIDVEHYGNDSVTIAASLLSASDSFEIKPLFALCLGWLRVHAGVEVFYALEFCQSAQYIQNRTNKDSAQQLLCEVFNQFAAPIIIDQDFPDVSFESLKSIIPHVTSKHFLHDMIYRWNSFDEHPVHEVQELLFLTKVDHQTLGVVEFSCPISSDLMEQSFRVIIECASETWSVSVGFDPNHFFTISSTEYRSISAVRHPEGSEEAFITSTSSERVEFRTQITCVEEHSIVDIFIGSKVISSLEFQADFGSQTFRVISRFGATIIVLKI